MGIFASGHGEEAAHQGAAGRAIDVVIGEYYDFAVVTNSFSKDVGGLVHVLKDARIRHVRDDPRVMKLGNVGIGDAAILCGRQHRQELVLRAVAPFGRVAGLQVRLNGRQCNRISL